MSNIPSLFFVNITLAFTMPTYGNIEQYDVKEDIESYLERVDQFFCANELTPTTETEATAVPKQTAIFLSSVGKSAYNVIQNLCKPKLPKEFTYKQLCKILVQHYSPTRLEVAETFKFHTKGIQMSDETVSQFVSRLRGLASTCNFGTFLPRALRDQFVVGCRNSESQHKLLQEDRSFDQCVAIAAADEAAVREFKQLHINNEETVHAVKPVNNNRGRGELTKRNQPYVCFTCGKAGHFRNNCQYKDSKCHNCGKLGHLSVVCKARPPANNALTCDSEELNTLVVPDNVNKNDDFYYSCVNASIDHTKIVDEQIFNINNTPNKGIIVTLNIQHCNVNMLLDTGCSLSVVPKHLFDRFKGNAIIKPCSIKLSTYTGETLSPLGTANVLVRHKGQYTSLPLLIVENGMQPLLGRNWLRYIRLDWSKIQDSLNYVNNISMPSNHASLDKLLLTYSKLFDGKLGCYSGEPVQLDVTETPKFHKARPVPFSLLPKVAAALKKLEDEGIIKHVTSAPCAAPIVPVIKRSGDIRLCGDFSVTYNKCAEPSKYPIPKLDHFASCFRGCSYFSKLDMSQACHQVPVHPESQKWLTVNTHLGLFVFTRIPNGIHSAPAEFQMIMDKTLAGIPKVVCYLDDILIGGSDVEDHADNLKLVFDRLSDAGFKLNKNKCTFQQKSVNYLGHMIDSVGLHPTQDKISAVKCAPAPTNVTQLKSFLGLIMFYSRFLKNHSTILAPLNKLLQKNVVFVWTKVENDAFIQAKKLLVDSHTLVHYNDSLPITLACDASAYGIGCVLSHNISGEERPIAFASSTLSTAQKNYSQLDKEALSIIYGLKRFHQYLYGRNFTIITDNKPLIHLFKPSAPAPMQAAARLQRWSLILASYDYSIQYRSTVNHSNADSMSRLPLPAEWSPPEENVNCMFFVDDIVSDLNHVNIGKCTLKDRLLSQVYRYVKYGWPESITDKDLLLYKNKYSELSIEDNCLLWNTRVVIPDVLRKFVLKELHDTHPGITHMRMLARSYVWWPNIDNAIENTVSTCDICQSMRNEPAKSHTHPWTYPSHAWSRIHVDFAGPISNQMYFVIVDAYSKYPEVIKMSSTTSEATINVLRCVFSRFGYPETLVSDNGPQFSSFDFSKFCIDNGINHVTSSVHKPSTNGQAERVVQVLKSAAKQSKLTGESLHTLLPRFLLRYRITPHSTTLRSPAMLFFGRSLRTTLDLMVPSVRNTVESKQQTLIDKSLSKGCREFNVGDRIFFRNYGKGEKWMKGYVVEKLGQRHYFIHSNVTGTVKRHIDQIIRNSGSITSDILTQPPSAEVNSENDPDTSDQTVHFPEQVPLPDNVIDSPPVSVPHDDPIIAHPSVPSSECPDKPVTPMSQNLPRRSGRTTRKPSYLKDYEP